MASTFDARSIITNFARDNASTPALKFISEDPEGVEIDDLIEYGDINYVYRVSSRDKKQSVIIKYGEEPLRSMPSEKLSLVRQVVEYEAMCLQYEVLPGSVSQPYCLDRKHNAIAMQDLGWETLEAQLQRWEVDLGVATFLGDQLAKLHKATTREAVGEERWQDMLTQFGNCEIKPFLGQVNYVHIFDESEDVLKMLPEGFRDTHRDYCRTIKDMGLHHTMETLSNVNECFVNADCHWKIIFVKEGRSTLFDCEFAFLSHPAVNLAFPATGYLFYDVLEKLAEPESNTDSQNFKMKLQQGTRHLVEGYLKASPHYTGCKQSTFLSQVALFIGADIFNFGVFADLEFFCEATPRQRAALIETGYKLMTHHDKVETVDQLLSAMFED